MAGVVDRVSEVEGCLGDVGRFFGRGGVPTTEGVMILIGFFADLGGSLV